MLATAAVASQAKKRSCCAKLSACRGEGKAGGGLDCWGEGCVTRGVGGGWGVGHFKEGVVYLSKACEASL